MTGGEREEEEARIADALTTYIKKSSSLSSSSSSVLGDYGVVHMRRLWGYDKKAAAEETLQRVFGVDIELRGLRTRIQQTHGARTHDVRDGTRKIRARSDETRREGECF